MRKLTSFLLILSLFLSACKKDEQPPKDPDGDLSEIPSNPEAFELIPPKGFSGMAIPMDNPMTKEGVALGRKLFYDPILSADSTMSCGSCHLTTGSFTDNLALSEGIDGVEGERSAMSLLNAAYLTNGLAWDGSSGSLEEQALEPVTNPIELHEEWTNVEEKLRRHASYPEDFRKAFSDIEHIDDITKEHATKAIAQFERTILSSGTSRYDQIYVLPYTPAMAPTESEQRGYEMFFDFQFNGLPDAECAHCHAPPLFTTNEYRNNGLDYVEELLDFSDLGRGAISGNIFDYGKFRVPTLRNVMFSAPYMHDGRFETMDEVLEHYNSGGKLSPNKDPLIYPLDLTPSQLDDIKAFLNMLTDTTTLNNPDYANPF